MRVMVFAKAVEDMEKGMAAPTPEMLEAFAAMDRFTDELVAAGVFVAAAGLKNGAQAKRIVREGAGSTVIDGPFAESRELIAGFSIWEVKDMDEAVAWAKRCPELHAGTQRDGDPAFLRGGGSRRVRDARGARERPGKGPAGSSASPESAGAILVPGAGVARSAGASGPWPTMRHDRERDAPGDRSDLSHGAGAADRRASPAGARCRAGRGTGAGRAGRALSDWPKSGVPAIPAPG
jgi:hypothetical protein